MLLPHALPAACILALLCATGPIRALNKLDQTKHPLSNGHATCAQALIQNFVRSTLTLTFVIAAARVVFNIKAQMMEERRWEMELRDEKTRMRRVEAVDKLLSVLTLLVASVFGLQAIGLDGIPRHRRCEHSCLGAYASV